MSDLILSLQITALGMGLVFGAILLLWLMMTLLTTLTADKEGAELAPAEVSASNSTGPASVSTDSDLARAAALAVAVALTNRSYPLPTRCPTPLQPLSRPGSWACRTRQMSEKGTFGKTLKMNAG